MSILAEARASVALDGDTQSCPRVYLAAKYEDRSEMCDLAEMLAQEGIECVSRWINDPEDKKYSASNRSQGQRDLADIRCADVFVVFCESVYRDSGSGGRHVETGYAMGEGIPIIFAGEPKHVFGSMPNTTVIEVSSRPVGTPFAKRLARMIHHVTGRVQ